jgi:hypothetical protein
VVFSIHYGTTLKVAGKFLDEVRAIRNKADFPVVIVGTQSDLSRDTPYEAGVSLAKLWNWSFTLNFFFFFH